MRTFTPHPAPKAHSYFLSQPHQPFFLFGVIWAIVSMILFTLSTKGVLTLSIDTAGFHLYTLAIVVFTQFFHGFLFTTFPRFCTSMAIPRDVYIRIVWLYQIGSSAFFIGALSFQWIAWAAMAVLLFAHIMAAYVLLWSYRMGQNSHKQDPFWILIAHAIAIAAQIIWITAIVASAFGFNINILSWLNPILVNLYLIFLTFSVAQRMIPFFSHSTESKSPRFVESVFTLLIFKTLFCVFAFPIVEAAVSILLSLYLVREFIRWKLSPFGSPAILLVLHLALYWLPAALFLGALFQLLEAFYDASYLFAGTHLLVLGFLTTVLIGFGTRVTLGHSGQPPHADTLTIVMFGWTQFLLIARLALSIDSGLGLSHGWLFDLASVSWMILFIVWGGRYGKVLLYGKH